MSPNQVVRGRLPRAGVEIGANASPTHPKETRGVSRGSVSDILKEIGHKVVPTGETTVPGAKGNGRPSVPDPVERSVR